MRGCHGAILAVLLGASALGAAPPEAPAPKSAPVALLKAQPGEMAGAAISGEKQVAPYKLARLTVKNVPVGYTILWDVYPFEGIDAATQKAKSLYEFAAPPGVYKVRVRAFKGEDVIEAWYAVTVGTPPAPGPTPPGPNPPGPQPDGKLGLVKASRDGFAKVTTGREKAPELAKAQRAHASAVAAGAFGNDAGQILAGWRASNKATVDPAQWAEWGKAVSAKFAELHTAGKLTTAAEWAAAFEEVAQGIGG